MKQKHQKHGLDCKDALLFHVTLKTVFSLNYCTAGKTVTQI